MWDTKFVLLLRITASLAFPSARSDLGSDLKTLSLAFQIEIQVRAPNPLRSSRFILHLADRLVFAVDLRAV